MLGRCAEHVPDRVPDLAGALTVRMLGLLVVLHEDDVHGRPCTRSHACLREGGSGRCALRTATRTAYPRGYNCVDAPGSWLS